MPNEKDDAQPNQPGTAQETASETQATWEAVLETLPEETRALYEGHTKGLKSALEDERRQRRELAGQLREASSQLEAGSKARTDLEKLQAQLEETQRRADFNADAHEQGVSNMRLAYLAAQEFDLFDRRGNVDWAKLKEAAPELFRQPQPARGNAGSGTAAPPSPAADMNAFIRRAAGRGG